MGALTNYGANTLIDTLLSSGAYVELHDGDPGDDATNNTITTSDDADYVRKSCTFGSASGKQAANTTSLSWTVNSGSSGYTVSHISLWDALTSGNPLYKGALLTPVTLAASDVFAALASGTIIVSLD